MQKLLHTILVLCESKDGFVRPSTTTTQSSKAASHFWLREGSKLWDLLCVIAVEPGATSGVPIGPATSSRVLPFPPLGTAAWTLLTAGPDLVLAASPALTTAAIVVSKSGSVRFFGHFGRTVNGTDGPVQSHWPNSELNLRFGSKGGPVQVLLRSNAEPNGLCSKKYEFIAKFVIYTTHT